MNVERLDFWAQYQGRMKSGVGGWCWVSSPHHGECRGEGCPPGTNSTEGPWSPPQNNWIKPLQVRPGHWHFKEHFSDSNVQARDENCSSRAQERSPEGWGCHHCLEEMLLNNHMHKQWHSLRVKKKCKRHLVKWLVTLLNCSWISIRFLAYGHSVSAWLPPGTGNSLPIKAV